MRGDLSAAALGLALCALAPAARAQDAEPLPPPEPAPLPPPPVAEPATEPAPPPEPAAPDAVVPEPAPGNERLELTGRVAVRDTLSTTDAGGSRSWLHSRTIDQARLAVDYERGDYLTMQIDLQFADDEVDLKDAYIRIEPGGGPWRLVGGRFKRPISYIGLESSWSLPTAERGLLSTIEIGGEDVPFTGERGQGLLVRYELPAPLEPRLSAAVFQNPLGTGPLGLDPSDHFTQDVHGRVEIEPARGWDVAAAVVVFGYLGTPGLADSYRHATIGSLETRFERRFLRAWAELYAGQSPYADDAALWAGRLLLSVPFVRDSWPKRIEPYAMAQLLDPDAGSGDDRNAELGGGLDLGFTKYLRLQVEAVHRSAEGLDALAIAGTELRVQLAARFSEEIGK